MLLWRPWSLFALLYFFKLSESVYWPAGKYGIPKAESGCPDADGFQWLTGRRYQDTENDNPANNRSSELHLDATVDKEGINRSFCIKINTTTDVKRSPWPRGKYCIYRKGSSCPTNLTTGLIKWDDENDNNKNEKSGTLPRGNYKKNTKIEFCCRTDGDKKDPISLPILTPFYLLAYESAECQQVKWAMASVEWIQFDNEDTDNKDTIEEAHPYDARVDNSTHRIYYCYYKGCNETVTGVNGTFYSPNYPKRYPDGQYCSWLMRVSPVQQIHLILTNFSLQSENNTDGLYVYDGENTTGKMLGVFYGGQAPPKEGIFSSSNNMLVIFKSDKTKSYAGFSASYSAVNRLASPSPSSSLTKTGVTSPLTSATIETITTTASGDVQSKKRGQTNKGKGFGIIFLVLPMVLSVLVVAVIIAACYYKRINVEISDKGESRKWKGENHHTHVEDTSVELRTVTCEADINAKA